MRSVGLGTVQVVVCNVEGQVFAYADRCPHLGSRLSEGAFDGRRITCAAHEWVFDARGGTALTQQGRSYTGIRPAWSTT